VGRSQEAVPKSSLPETTSAENLVRYIGGKCLATSRGEAADAINAQLRDFSGFTGHGDEAHWQVEQLDGKSVG
jgi:hypothetical protein